MIVPFITESYANSFSVDKVSGLYRLKGPTSTVPEVLTSRTATQGGDCKGRSTVDLVLKFPTSPTAWLESVPTRIEGVCDLSATPQGEGFEFRFSYPVQGKASDWVLRTLVFSTPSSFVVDHWVERAQPSARTKNTAAKVAKPKSKASKSDKSPFEALPEGTALLTAFDDEGSWEKILGGGAQPLDLNSAEFERFQGNVASGVRDKPDARPESLPLQVPLLELGPADVGLDFTEEPFSFDEFRAQIGASREAKAAIDGMNFVRKLAQEGKWLKAQQSIAILEKSQFASKVPLNDARWWALKGLIYVKLSMDLKERAMLRVGLGLWREGLRRTAGLGGLHREFAEYMALESVRTLFDSNLDYAAASLLTWLQRYTWTERAEERFAYMRAKALLQLGLYPDAEKLFSEFVAARAAVPLSGQIDRRLVPASAFRLGDIAYRQRRYKESIAEYSKAFTQLMGPNRFAFEGTWFPDQVRSFPFVLLNRGSAFIREGLHANALRDLRTFLFVAPTHSDAGWAYFLIGDLLMRSDETDKAINTWRECAFKVPDSAGSRLCTARLTAHELPQLSKERWPRLIATIEDARPARLKTPDRLVSTADLESYVSLLLADAFIRANEPGQALIRLDGLRRIEPHKNMQAWVNEYLVTAFTGVLRTRVNEKAFKDAISEYEKRRTTLFLREVRTDALYAVALAHEGLALWAEARETISTSDTLRKKIGVLAARPFHATDMEWNLLRARVEIELYALSRLDEKTVRLTLETLRDSEQAGRAWIRFFQIKDSPSDEATRWKKLAGLTALTWKDIRRYSQVLKKLDRSSERRRLVESRVGAWFSERQKPTAVLSPGPDLLWELFEVRETSDASAALAVCDHLLTLTEAELGSDVTKPMIAYRKGQVLRRLSRFDDARASFALSRTLDPLGVWGKLSAVAEREMTEGRSL